MAEDLAAKDGDKKGKRSMPGSERKAVAKEVDAVFSTAAVAETRGGGGEGGERRQRATGVGDSRVDGRLGGGDGGSVRTRRRDQWRETATSRPWRQQRTATEENRPSGNRERRRRWLGLCGVEKETEEKEDGCNGELKGGTGGLMKTETRPTATEKSGGREDPHVVGDGNEEEGERETAAATKFAEDPSTASRRRKAVGFAVTAVKEEKGTADSGGRGRRGRRYRRGRRWKRERREEKPGLTASRGRGARSGGRRQRSASKSGEAGARRDHGGREKLFFFF